MIEPALPLVDAVRPLSDSVQHRMLIDGPELRVLAWRCCCDGEALRAERQHQVPTLSVLGGGACRVRAGRSEHVLDPVGATLFRPGVGYRTEHPYGVFDYGFNLALVGELGHRLLHHWSTAAPFATLPIESAQLLALGEVARRGDQLELEERCFTLIDRLLGDELTALEPAHRHLAQQARQYLVAEPDRAWSLSELAALSRVSAGHLSRVFRKAWGLPAYEVLLRLRIARLVERLEADPSQDLADLAVDLGFASHSHMTSTVARRLGRPPSAIADSIRITEAPIH